MKNIFLLITLLGLYNCDINDCFESTGEIIQKEIELDIFEKIEVGNEVTLIIKQGATQKVIIETGENLLDDVTVEVIDGKLFMKDESSCNLTRDYAVTKVYVTSPNIKEIRNSSNRNILSRGVLKFPVLFLLSEDFQDSNSLNIGNFELEVDMDNLIIRANGNSQFYLKGKTNGLRVEFHSGSPRFEGKFLITKKAFIIHKGTNDILINPQNRIEGNIYSIGDVISYNHPPIIEVEEHYSGKLIFK